MLLTGFVVINLTRSLGFLALFQAVAFAGSALAVVWNWRGLCSRVAEVHLNAAVLLLAAMLLYQAIKAGVLMAQLPAGGLVFVVQRVKFSDVINMHAGVRLLGPSFAGLKSGRVTCAL